MSKKKSNKKSKNRIIYTGIIHGQNSIYINKVKSYDGKRSDKITCMFYNKDTMKCTNEKCHTVICTTAYNCTLYKRKLKMEWIEFCIDLFIDKVM